MEHSKTHKAMHTENIINYFHRTNQRYVSLFYQKIGLEKKIQCFPKHTYFY